MKHILKNTWSILSSRERREFIFLMSLDILISLADIAFLAVLLFIVQFYTQPLFSKFSFLPAWLADRNSSLLILLFFFLFSLKNLFGFLIYRKQIKFLSRVTVNISQNMLRQYLQGSYSNYVDIDSAIYVRKIVHQPVEFAQNILGGIQQIITQFALILFSIVAILIFNAKIFLLLFVILLPPVIAVFYLVKRKLRHVKTNLKQANERSLQHVHEALSGFIESNIYDRVHFFLNRFAGDFKKFSSHHSNLVITQGIPARMIEVFALFGLFILIALNKWSGNADSSTLVTIGAFMAAAYKIIPGIVKILNTSGQMNAYSYTASELMQSTDASLNRQTGGQKKIESIELKGVSFRYGNEFLFKDLDLSIHRGDVLGISGLSGKGKTTVLHLLLGFLKPASGEILVNEKMVTDGELQQYWTNIAYVQQDSFLIHDTIEKNITLSDVPADKQKLYEVIRLSGLDELIGQDKLVTEGGKNISGGQRQRIAIARALYKNANVILLDEPFNELDEGSEENFLTHFKKLAATGKMIILITHNQKSLASCTKIFSFDNMENKA